MSIGFRRSDSPLPEKYSSQESEIVFEENHLIISNDRLLFTLYHHHHHPSPLVDIGLLPRMPIPLTVVKIKKLQMPG